MPDFTARNRRRDKQKIRRIERKAAERIFARLEHLLEGNDLLAAGFDHFLSQLEESTLQLAVQPDMWGERTRARLVSTIMGSLRGVPAESATVQEIVDISNSVMPCFLLELGRRKQHIEVEFPKDPCHPGCSFQVSVGLGHRRHRITGLQLSQLVTEAGEELVGLCYFGDQQSREFIDSELNRGNAVANSRARPCRISPSASPKNKH
jgi:hypothetical protein